MRMARHLILGASKTQNWAGATPFLGAFGYPKNLGVAPDRHAGVPVFCQRAGIEECKA
jgi:hypothetical protein